VYRPPDKSVPYLQEVCQTLDNIICDNPDDVIWLAGDINLPNIEWASSSIKNSSYPIPLCEEEFLDLINTHSLTQVVDFPTRDNNILDIFITNRPSLIKQCYPKPGISDHEIVYVESYIKAPIQQVYKRKLYNWSKADFGKLKQDFIRFSDKFLNDYSTDTPISEEFKQVCSECLQQVPKLSPGNHGLAPM